MTITIVFCGLNIVNHLLTQMLKSLRFSFKTLSNSFAKPTEEILREVSSAISLCNLQYHLNIIKTKVGPIQNLVAPNI